MAGVNPKDPMQTQDATTSDEAQQEALRANSPEPQQGPAELDVSPIVKANNALASQAGPAEGLTGTMDPFKPLPPGAFMGVTAMRKWSDHTFGVQNEEASPEELSTAFENHRLFNEGLNKTGIKSMGVGDGFKLYQQFLQQWNESAPKVEDFIDPQTQQLKMDIRQQLLSPRPERQTANWNSIPDGQKGFAIGRAISAALSGGSFADINMAFADVLNTHQGSLDTQYQQQVDDWGMSGKMGDVVLRDIEMSDKINNDAFQMASRSHQMLGLDALGFIQDQAKQDDISARAEFTQGQINNRTLANIPFKAAKAVSDARRTGGAPAAVELARQYRDQGMPGFENPEAWAQPTAQETMLVKRGNYLDFMQEYRQATFVFDMQKHMDNVNYQEKRLAIEREALNSLNGYRSGQLRLGEGNLALDRWYKENAMQLGLDKFGQDNIGDELGAAETILKSIEDDSKFFNSQIADITNQIMDIEETEEGERTSSQKKMLEDLNVQLKEARKNFKAIPERRKAAEGAITNIKQRVREKPTRELQPMRGQIG